MAHQKLRPKTQWEKKKWRKEYIVAASCIALVALLKTLSEKIQKKSPRKKEYNTVFKTFAIFRIVLYVSSRT